ncbi:hypothetical protein CLFO_28390 [Clostridium formicaceticum]|uniref:Uncharacterized protein n=1 Tax=Clostridium formicaceticum TaxID=1497 RepID=A0AAC9RLW8_9CLOT|nr:hypothetical protein BJL90_19345 [Clostridium formicaceticum]ARE88436.1 hypothetical protein CLFO_28390 [Clostridium formicaceticum]
MVKNKKWRIIVHLLTFTQIILVGVVLIVEKLSKKKMGVVRYLVFKNHVFEATWFTPSLMNFYKILLAICFFAYLICLIRSLRNTNKRFLFCQFIAILLNAIILLSFFTNLVVAMKVYYYFIIVLVICLILQYCKILIHLYVLRRHSYLA